LTSLPIRARRLLAITDLTDEQNPEQLSRTSYATAAYVHQGWLTPNHKYFLSNDELDEVGGEVSSTTTYMWDLRDLDDPLMLGGDEHGTQSIDHQLFIKGDIATESSYMSGVRVLSTEKIRRGNSAPRASSTCTRSRTGWTSPGTWGQLPVLRLRGRCRDRHGRGTVRAAPRGEARP
jgi:choice-of-anchor B domain-containing protein